MCSHGFFNPVSMVIAVAGTSLKGAMFSCMDSSSLLLSDSLSSLEEVSGYSCASTAKGDNCGIGVEVLEPDERRRRISFRPKAKIAEICFCIDSVSSSSCSMDSTNSVAVMVGTGNCS